jgi:hypothetical protein
VRPEQHSQTRAAGRHHEGVPRRTRRDRTGRANRQHVSGGDRAAAERTHAAHQARRAAPERQTHIEPAAHGEARACAGASRAEPHSRAGVRDERTVRFDRTPIHGQDELRTRDRTDDVTVALELRSEQCDLERRRGVRVPGEAVGAAVRVRVHRAGHRHAGVLVPPAAKVLHGGQHARADHSQ